MPTEHDAATAPDAHTGETFGGDGTTRRGEPGFRTPPPEIVEAAKVVPHHWVAMVDSIGDGPQPDCATVGRWRTDGDGEIVEWEAHPDYRPSPLTLGWAPPVSDADAAAQLAATGYGPRETVALALLGTDVAVCVDENGELSERETDEGELAVPVFSTSPELDAEKLPAHEVMPVATFLDRLPAERDVLFLSSSAPVALVIDPDELRAYGAEEAPSAPAT
ncbi:type VII secretion system-associated protein [Streptomyces sp. NPDC048636]|uniref:type VII secretion system-associated protein n=1 Tax=Streptomyces sp. NPDC048636 TaxID=3155762 RepID=UPI00344869E0